MTILPLRLKPFAGAMLAILATAFGVSALVPPGKGLLPTWRAAPLSTVLPASIKPSTTFAVTPELPGQVVTVLVAPGARVQPGQVLATIESDQLNGELERALRHLKFAESRKAALRPTGARKAKRIQLERYQSALRARKAARERLSAYSVGEMEKAWQQAKRRTEQVRSLVEQQLATAAELDDTVARERDALSSFKAAREHYSRLRQEADLADLQARLVRTESTPSVDSNAMLAAQLELEDAKEALRRAKDLERARNITAPRGGTVLRADIHPGDRVVLGQALFQIADLSELNFEVPVSAGIAEQIHPGRAVVVRIPTDPPRSQPAEVSAVLLSPDQGHASYIVRITIPNPSPDAILAGLEGAVEFPHLESKWKLRPSY